MNITTFNLRAKLAELEAKNDKRYTQAEIARGTGGRLSRQHIRALLSKTSTRIDVETLGALRDFFEAEGMQLTTGDLFADTTTDAP